MTSAAAEFEKKRIKRRLETCQHFTGIQHRRCKMEVCYDHVRGDKPYALACFHDERWEEGGRPHCTSYLAMTEEQVAAEEAEFERDLALIAKKLSPCCEAPFDESQVITSGRHKNHGPRFCSKCKRVVMWV